MAWNDVQTASDNITHTEWNTMVTYIVRNVSIQTSYCSASQGSVVLANATSGTVSVWLPVSPTRGDIVDVQKIDSSGNSVVVGGNGLTINDDTTFTISSQYESYTFTTDTVKWYII